MKERMGIRKKLNSKIFLEILKSILMITPIPIAIIVIFELTSIHMMQSTEEKFETSMMSRVISEVNRDLQGARKAMIEIKQDELLLNYERQEMRDYWIERQLRDKLRRVVSSRNVIEEVYIYFEEYDYVLSSVSGISSRAYYEQNYAGSYETWMRKIGSDSSGKFRIVLGKGAEEKLVMVSSVGDSYPYKCQVVLQLNETYLKETIKSMCSTPEEYVFLFMGDTSIVNTYDGENKEIAEQYVLGVIEGEKESFWMENIHYHAVSMPSVETGMTLVHIVSKEMQYTAVNFTKIVGSIILAVCVIILILISFFVANRTYRPILGVFNVMKEMETDEEGLQENFEFLENYLRKLTHTRGEYEKQLKEYEDDVKTYYLENLLFKGNCKSGVKKQIQEWGFNQKYFAVLLFIFDFSEEILEEQDDEWKKDILNIYIKEKFAGKDAFWIVGEHENYYCVLNGQGENTEEFEKKLEERKVDLKNILAREEGFFGEIYVSKVYTELEELQQAYVEVKEKWQEEISTEFLKEEQKSECSVDRVKEIVNKNLSDVNLSAAYIAEKTNVTCSHLSRFFKVHMGIGVLEYIHRCRIDRAKEILRIQPKMMIKEVANSVGFYNIATFIRVFKKLEGITPGQYREMLEEK